ncbi:MAG: DUF1643 domain-containing protein [Phormidesmis sp.]
MSTALVSTLRPVQSIERTAVFDSTGHYRYRLGRRWQPSGIEIAFVMLNPSRADAACDDPTLRACIQFAQRWNCAALSVVNLFGYRTPHPSELKQAQDPVGPENDAYVLQAVSEAEKVVLAWGNEGKLWARDRAMLNQLTPHQHKLYCIQRNRSGQPRHPLYIPRTLPLQKFES